MRDTAFLRSDELPGNAALGYLEIDGVWRSNVFHLPVRGSGDGGIYTTVGDVSSFWKAFISGRIVSSDWMREMVLPRSVASDGRRYGLGFWLHATTDAVILEGCDAGVSFRSVRDPGCSGHVHRDLEHHGRRLADLPVLGRPARHLTAGVLEPLFELGDPARCPVAIHLRLTKRSRRLFELALELLRLVPAWTGVPARPSAPASVASVRPRSSPPVHRRLSARPPPTARPGVAGPR